MQTINTDDIKLHNTIITLGKFDGNHKGHRALFDEALKIKSLCDEPLSTVLFTFDINPRQAVSNTKTGVLYTNAERIESGEDTGLDFCFIWPFTRENMQMEPEAFVRDILCEKLGARHIVTGEDFRFGKDRKGDGALLKELGEELGFSVHTVPTVMYKGLKISSSRIKQALSEGKLDEANEMLGRPFAVTAKVVSGKHLGRNLGFPTINFNVPEDKIIPQNGVYATKTYVDGAPYISMTNIGTRPTFEEGVSRNIETNIFDFDQDIYGKDVRVEFYGFIRAEKHFESADELVEELGKNREQIKNYFISSKIR